MEKVQGATLGIDKSNGCAECPGIKRKVPVPAPRSPLSTGNTDGWIVKPQKDPACITGMGDQGSGFLT